MAMHNPPHPGEFITQMYLSPNGLSGRELALKLGVAASTLSRVLKGSSGITPEMALRLCKALGRSPGSWLAMRYNHDLWHARQRVNLANVGKVRLTAAYPSFHPSPLAPSGVRDAGKLVRWASRESSVHTQ